MRETDQLRDRTITKRDTNLYKKYFYMVGTTGLSFLHELKLYLEHLLLYGPYNRFFSVFWIR